MARPSRSTPAWAYTRCNGDTQPPEELLTAANLLNTSVLFSWRTAVSPYGILIILFSLNHELCWHPDAVPFRDARVFVSYKGIVLLL